jgi:hypothetical protein
MVRAANPTVAVLSRALILAHRAPRQDRYPPTHPPESCDFFAGLRLVTRAYWDNSAGVGLDFECVLQSEQMHHGTHGSRPHTPAILSARGSR